MHGYIYKPRLLLPPVAYRHGSRDESPAEPPQWENRDNDGPDQRHLVVLELDVPALQECLIYEGLNELWGQTDLFIKECKCKHSGG